MKKPRRDNPRHKSTTCIAERLSTAGCLKHKGRVSGDAAFQTHYASFPIETFEEIYRSASVKFTSLSNSSISESDLPFVVDG